MKLSAEKNPTNQLLQTLAKQNITVFLNTQHILQNTFKSLINQAFHIDCFSSIGFISSKNTFFPYFSIIDNLFFGVSIKKKQKKQYLDTYLNYVALPPAILIKSSQDISFFECIKLQLIQQLLLNKRTIVIDNIFQHLSVFQCQELLPLLSLIAKEKNKAILILSDDQLLAESPYIDVII